jgi:hypothetical protein
MTAPPKNGQYLCRKEAAAYLTSLGCAISGNTLRNRAKHNNAGKGPPFTRFGWRTVRYAKADLDEWVKQQGRKVG